eukprot:gi/632972922/ref/XP_007902896.1/ PREDICTED: rano class II histocompatibility antigen, B-1 beta chain-like [Callorhinchus milii]
MLVIFLLQQASLIGMMFTAVDGTAIRVIQLPKHVEATRGTNITFYCIFPIDQPNPRLKVYWWKHGNDEYLQTRSDKRKIFGLENKQRGFFQLLNVSFHDSGVYYCAPVLQGKLAGSGPGSCLAVLALPTPLKIFSRVPERFSSAFLVLVCETAMFYPENLNLSWYKNGIEISSGITITKQQNAEGLYEASSSITETQTVRTETVYTCQVSHPSLQSPGIANYTVNLFDAGLDDKPYAIAISRFTLSMLLILFLAIIIVDHFRKNPL